MRFERGLRGIALKSYPAGYAAIPTEDVNKDTPQLHIGEGKDSGVWLEGQEFPSTIELVVCVIPIWVKNETASGMFIKSAKCSIYSAKDIYSGIEIYTKGSGTFYKSNDERGEIVEGRFLCYQLEIPRPCLYHKEFLTQEIGKEIHYAPGEETVPFLWAYGGGEIDGDIHPFVFSLESIRDETVVRTSSLLHWREHSILPPLIGEVLVNKSPIQDSFAKAQTLTLKESIEAGECRIHLKIGVDERGVELKIPYSSISFANNTIIYKREGPE